MSTAAILRRQIEAALASRIPSALTPVPRIIRPLAPTGIAEVDALLQGGLPLGAITELIGPECSGRTSLALSFIARITQAAKVCAWVDVSNTLQPESAAAAGVDLSRMLWVRCGVQQAASVLSPRRDGFTLPAKYLVPPPVTKGLHGGGFGPHPRHEDKGLSDAVSSLFAPRCAEPQPRLRPEGHDPDSHEKDRREPAFPRPPSRAAARHRSSPRPWPRIEQALRVADLLLQAGGFSALVLDMASLAPEYVSRVPLATWFRYRAAAERTQASVLLLAQHPCAKSSGELQLRFHPGTPRCDEPTLFTGIEHRVEVDHRRFGPDPGNVVPLRKPPQRVNTAQWRSRTVWAGPR